jgi:putative phage-type endonuclease
MIDQRSPEWLKLRAGRFTASRAQDLMARTKSGPSTSRKNLITRLAVERIIGTCVETYSNFAMQRGTDLEPTAIKAYEDSELLVVERVAFVQHPNLDFVSCSPDGIVGEDGMVEVKCPTAEAKHYEALRFGAHAKEYKWQLQSQLWVTGRDWVDAVSFDDRFPPGLQLAIVRVERDEKAIEELEAECIAANEEVEEQVRWFRDKQEAA